MKLKEYVQQHLDVTTRKEAESFLKKLIYSDELDSSSRSRFSPAEVQEIQNVYDQFVGLLSSSSVLLDLVELAELPTKNRHNPQFAQPRKVLEAEVEAGDLSTLEEFIRIGHDSEFTITSAIITATLIHLSPILKSAYDSILDKVDQAISAEQEAEGQALADRLIEESRISEEIQEGTRLALEDLGDGAYISPEIDEEN